MHAKGQPHTKTKNTSGNNNSERDLVKGSTMVAYMLYEEESLLGEKIDFKITIHCGTIMIS
jgi:hypothetical protein